MKEYQPFAYPPNYQIAKIHKQATMPGKVNPQSSVECPCCSLRTKQPLKSWLSRSVDQDFKNKGGAVITYFWLVKLYCFMSLIVLIIYSSYLIGSIHRICGIAKTDQQILIKCQRFLGLWIITNQSLFEVMKILHQNQAITRIYTLRTITYVLLLIGNLMALYTSGRFKRRYPQPKDISSFSLIFKNVTKSIQQFNLQLQQKFNNPTIVQIFNIKRMQPFYTLYNSKLQVYYQSKIQSDIKKKKKMLKILDSLDRKCTKFQADYEHLSDRVIVVFNDQATRNRIKQAYELKGMDKVKYLIGLQGSKQQYCQSCPIPEQIIWNNIGSNQSHKIKLKILSVVYFFLLIGGSYLFLAFCMKLCYDRDILPSPWNVIIANIIMTLMVPVALTFRQLMNKLSEMRRPNTQTNRTMFIVITTVLFHFIYYIIIPTFYLKFSKDVQRNQVLFIITNQTFNFLIVQFILAYIDLMFCQWNKRLKRVEDQQKPIGCQKLLHEQIQYPRFPIQFKLIILFKTYSFIILFAFQSPLIMFLCFALLLFLYFSDKHSVYRHYRMEIIDNGVQYRFLKVYSIFFSVYTFLIYSLTQHFEDLGAQFYSALVLMIVAILIQIFFLKDRIFEDETILPQTLQQLQLADSYKKRFEKFREHVVDDQVDHQIQQYLAKSGHGSLKTEETISSKDKLIES